MYILYIHIHTYIYIMVYTEYTDCNISIKY